MQRDDYDSIPGSTTDLGQGEHDAPHLTFVAETIFADNLQFRIPGEGSVSCNDISRGKLVLSGRDILTDGRTRKLGNSSALTRKTYDFLSWILTTPRDFVGLGV